MRITPNCWCGSGLTVWECLVSWRRYYHNALPLIDMVDIGALTAPLEGEPCPACGGQVGDHLIATNELGEHHLICKSEVAWQ